MLTDFRMSGMDGLQTMLAIKALKPEIRVTIIYGFASAEAVQRALARPSPSS